MAVVNRTLDPSQQRTVMHLALGAVATGVTSIVGIVPWPCVIDATQLALNGVSATPTYELGVNRFIVGSGFTYLIIAKGTSNALAYDYGVSGVVSTGMFQAAAGSTLLNLQANDQLVLTSGGSGAAVKSLAIGCVLRPIKDIKKYFGGIA